MIPELCIIHIYRSLSNNGRTYLSKGMDMFAVPPPLDSRRTANTQQQHTESDTINQYENREKTRAE